jgi:predicted nucleic acid-binding protein
MTRYAIDLGTTLRLIRDGRPVAAEHRLVAPARLRADVLAALYSEVRAGRLDDRTGRRELELFAELPIRLLGDRVSRSTAWTIARDLDWDDVGHAEYLAVAKLQSDALITDDSRLVAGASGVIPVAPFDALFD